MLLDTFLPELSRLRNVDPVLVEHELARYGLFTRGRALDLSLSQQEADPFNTFLSSIVKHTGRDLDLSAWSLTTPKGNDSRGSVMAAGRELLARINAFGDRAGAWFARDRRDVDGDAGHHLYGLTAAKREKRTEIRDAWIGITGASRRSIAVRTVGLWKHYAETGDDGRLRPHLTRITRYGLHELPRGEVRDLDTDVMASGLLAGPWRALREAGAPLPAAALQSPLSRQRPIRAAVTAACLVCGRSLADKRAGTRTCGDRCRTQKHRNEKGSKR